MRFPLFLEKLEHPDSWSSSCGLTVEIEITKKSLGVLLARFRQLRKFGGRTEMLRLKWWLVPPPAFLDRLLTVACCAMSRRRS
jgi:hypothetical protein